MKFLWFLLRIKGYFFRLDMWNRGRLYFILMALMAVSREAIMGHGSVIWQALRKQAQVFLRLCIKKEFIKISQSIYIVVSSSGSFLRTGKGSQKDSRQNARRCLPVCLPEWTNAVPYIWQPEQFRHS